MLGVKSVMSVLCCLTLRTNWSLISLSAFLTCDTSLLQYCLLMCCYQPLCSSLLQATESELGDVDLSGLPEAAVDSEEEEEEDEDLERATDTLLGRDLVRECLEKDPVDRNDDDIGQSEALLPFCLYLTISLPVKVNFSCLSVISQWGANFISIKCTLLWRNKALAQSVPACHTWGGLSVAIFSRSTRETQPSETPFIIQRAQWEIHKRPSHRRTPHSGL